MKVTIVQIPGNIIGVDSSEPRYLVSGKWYYRGENRIDGGIIQKADENSGFYSDVWLPILFSTVRIDPEIPLCKEEDLLLNNRYFVTNEGSRDYWYVFDKQDQSLYLPDAIARFGYKSKAEEYAAWLNSREQGVDVIELAAKAFPLKDVSSIAKEQDYDAALAFNNEQKYSRKIFIAGYNTAFKFGYSEEDMRSAIHFGTNLQYGVIPEDQMYITENGKKRYAPDDIFIASLKPKPLYKETVQIEMDNDKPVIEDGFVKFISN